MNRCICCKTSIPDNQFICLNCLQEYDNKYEEMEDLYEKTIKEIK
jgi:hypothetical protein